MNSKIVLMMLFPMAAHILNMEQRGECMILLNGNVLDYVTGTVLGKIEDGRFVAKTEEEMSTRVLSRCHSMNKNGSSTK